VRPLACDSHRPERSGAWVEADAGTEDAASSLPVAGPGVRGAGSPPTHNMPVDAVLGGIDPSRPSSGERVGPTVVGVTDGGIGLLAPGRTEAPRPEAGPLAALRLLEAPEPVEVECVGGTPSVVWWRGRRMPVARASGPERLSGDWWRDAYRRDYWRCEAGESEFVVYVDRGHGTAAGAAPWYLHGWYD
jgi:hypothetical protein